MSDAAASPDVAAPAAAEASDSSDTGIPLPADADSWRVLIARIPPRDLLRILVKDKAVQGKIFAGFRPGPDTLRRSLVVQRIVELAQKDGKWARQIADMSPPPQPAHSPPLLMKPDIKHDSLGHNLADPEPLPDDPRLKSKLKQQRADLREKDLLIASLEARLNAAQSERDSARQLAAEADAARRSSEADVERERHHRQRAARREDRVKAPTPAAQPKSAPVGSSAASLPASAEGLLLEGLQRLMSRGKYALVAEVCREAIAAEENSTESFAAARGRVRAIFAAALYGAGHAALAAAQDQMAATLLIDGGDLSAATACLGRVLIFAPGVRPTSLTATFRRLLTLADKHGRLEQVSDALTHVRIASPDAQGRLSESLAGISGPAGKLVERLKFGGTSLQVGPDEEIALPTTSQRTAAVSARRIVRAFETGDANFIADARSGLRLLQSQGAEPGAIAKALLEATAALDPLAAAPLGQSANHPVVVDASNVARYNPDPLSLTKVTRVENLLAMRRYLVRRGFFPVLLVADANLRFKVDSKASYLDLVTRGIVRETPPGTSADEELLALARGLRAPVITNDRLADWGDRAAGIERLGFVFERDSVSLTPF